MYLNGKRNWMMLTLVGTYRFDIALIIKIHIYIYIYARSLKFIQNDYHNSKKCIISASLTNKKHVTYTSLLLPFTEQHTKEAWRTATKGSLWTTGEGCRTQAWDWTRKGGETRAGAWKLAWMKTTTSSMHVWYTLWAIYNNLSRRLVTPNGGWSHSEIPQMFHEFILKNNFFWLSWSGFSSL